MKKLLALFVTSLIVLTSMSDCKKDIDSVLKGTEEDILISVDVNGRPHETTKFRKKGLFLKTDYKLFLKNMMRRQILWDMNCMILQNIVGRKSGTTLSLFLSESE